MASSAPGSVAHPARRFATTRWSLILRAREGNAAPARAALEELCEAYWLPVYGFMRRQTKDLHEAQDLTQGFFASLLSRNAVAKVDPTLGRFRSFLLAAARNFVCNERDKKSTVSRGGQVVLQSLNFELGEQQLSEELSHDQSAEEIFERRWALALLERVLNRLRQEYELAGRQSLFETLSGHLSGPPEDASLSDAAMRLQMSSEAIRVALHRLIKRYRHILRDEIAQTTDSTDDVDDEIRQLFIALRAT